MAPFQLKTKAEKHDKIIKVYIKNSLDWRITYILYVEKYKIMHLRIEYKYKIRSQM